MDIGFGLDLISLLVVTVPAALLFGIVMIRRYRRAGQSSGRAAFIAAVDALLLASVLGIASVALWPLQLLQAAPDFARLNLVPLADMIRFVVGGGSFRFIGGNLLLFLPFGFFAALRFAAPFAGASVRRLTLTGAAFSIFLETMQLFHPVRGTNIDDVIMNTLGTLLGAFIGVVVRRYLAHQDRRLF